MTFYGLGVVLLAFALLNCSIISLSSSSNDSGLNLKKLRKIIIKWSTIIKSSVYLPTAFRESHAAEYVSF